MKIISTTLILAASLCLGTGCTSSKSQPASEPVSKAVETPAATAQPQCKALVQKAALPKSDMVERVEAAVTGDCLDLKLTFGGGCKDHLFDLYWDGSFLKSFPPQANLTLIHDKQGDECKAIVEQNASFDLKPLQNGGEVVINLLVGGQPTQKISYKQ